MKSYKLMVAGPVNPTSSIKSLKQFPAIGHRESEFSDLYKKCKEYLFKLFEANAKHYEIVIIGGSGTAAMECVMSSVLQPDKRTLVISNGGFGERWKEICDIYKIPHKYLNFGWGNYPNLMQIETILVYMEFEAVIMVHMETSTGMLNPIHEVGKLCKKYKKTFIVDSVCGIEGEQLNMINDNIDFCVASTNKGIGGPPVLGLICCKKSKLKNLQKRNYYLDLARYLEFGKRNLTPTTPAIPLFFMLRDTLEDLFKEGLDERYERFKQNNILLKQELKKLGLKFYLKDHMSNIMTNVLIPKGFAYDYIHDELKKKGYIIYAGKERLHNKVMHIANVGALTKKDIIKFVKTLKKILKSKIWKKK